MDIFYAALEMSIKICSLRDLSRMCRRYTFGAALSLSHVRDEPLLVGFRFPIWRYKKEKQQNKRGTDEAELSPSAGGENG